MSTKRISAGEFKRSPAHARKLADKHDVVIELRGLPAAVLISFERYQRLTGTGRTPIEAIADPAATDIEFEAPRFDDPPTPADF